MQGYKRQHEISNSKNLSTRVSGKISYSNGICGLIFLSIERSVCDSVWINLLKTSTHTSSCPVKPPPHAPSSRPWNNSSACSSQKPDPQTAEHLGANHLGNWSSQRLTFTRPVLLGLFGGNVTFSKYKHGADQTGVFLFFISPSYLRHFSKVSLPVFL